MFVAAGLTVSVVSVLWPRFSDTPPPAPIATIGNIVSQTPVGQAIENVLGASTQSATDSASPSASIVDNIKHAITS